MVVGALSRKERAKPCSVKALNLRIQSNLPAKIREAQPKAPNEENKVEECM